MAKVRVITLLFVLVLVGSLVLVNTISINNLAFAGGYSNKDKKDESKKTESKFNEGDFMIKDFGINNDGNPFIIVEGTAGGSTPESKALIYAYAFVTDNGTYAATSHGGEDSSEVGNDIQWHTHQVALDEKNCVASINDNGKNELSKDTITITDTNATKVDKVMTAELYVNSTDGSTCISKVLDSAP